LSLQIGQSILIRTFELKIGDPRTVGDLFIGERASVPALALVLPFSRRFFCPKQDSIWPLPTVLPSKRNHHCLRVWLNGPRRARDWSAASSINLISNALSAFASSSRFFVPPVTTHSIVDLLNPWTSRNFQFFRVPREESICSGRVVLPCYCPVPGSWNQQRWLHRLLLEMEMENT